MATPLGFEPRITPPKGAVLPLHHGVCGFVLPPAKGSSPLPDPAIPKSLESFLKAKWQMMRRPKQQTIRTDVYEIRPRADKDGVDLVINVLPFSPMWYRGPKAIRDAIDHAKFFSRCQKTVIGVYDAAGNVIETHEHAGEVKEW